MRRRGLPLALGALLLALPAVAQPADEPSKCERLDATHDLAPAKKVKLVRLGNDEGGTDLVGCVLPDGKVVRVASSDGQNASYDVRQVAGHHVLVDEHSDSADSTTVVDLKRRTRYKIALARRALINSSGQAVAVERSADSDLITVEGFSPRGNRVTLDSGTRGEIPPSSLRLDGHIASWTHNGARKSARLPGVSGCQKLKAENDLAGAAKVKLVERKNVEGGTDVVGCVLPRGRVSVVASSAKTPGTERSYQLLQVEGHVVLVRGELLNTYGHGVSTYVYDIKRARSYNIAEICFSDAGPACDPQTRSRRAFVNAQAQAAAIVTTEGSSERQVLGFRSTGASRVLDSGTAAEIPLTSLSLEGHVVRWTHSGEPKSATLSG